MNWALSYWINRVVAEAGSHRLFSWLVSLQLIKIAWHLIDHTFNFGVHTRRTASYGRSCQGLSSHNVPLFVRALKRNVATPMVALSNRFGKFLLLQVPLASLANFNWSKNYSDPIYYTSSAWRCLLTLHRSLSGLKPWGAAEWFLTR